MKIINHWIGILKNKYTQAYFLIGIYILYSRFYGLNTQFKYLGLQEKLQSIQTSKINIISYPFDFFYTYMQKILFEFIPNENWALRLPSAIISVFAVIAVFELVRIWWNRRLALIAMILASSSAWILSFSRIGMPGIEILLLSCISLILISYFLENPTHIKAAYIGLILGVSLYTPGMIYVWLGIGLGLILLKQLGNIHITLMETLTTLITALIALGPLVISAINNPTVLYRLLGIADGIFLGSISQSAQNFVRHYTFSSPSTEYAYLPNEPLIPLAMVLLSIFGLYELIKNRRENSSIFILCIGIVCSMGIIIGGALNFTTYMLLAMPIFIMSSVGIGSLLHRWYAMFPLNPAARSVVIVPVMLLAVVIAWSQHRLFFDAFSYNPDIQSHYQHKISADNDL